MDPLTKALCDSIRTAPLLAGDLPPASVFDRTLLAEPATGVTLNLNQKLGHLYEEALLLCLKTSPSLTCLATHLQIFDDNRRTLGELDFILFDQAVRRAIHLELAVKFYLAVPSDQGWHFPGPNPHDSWQKKCDRLIQHQLLLSQRPEARTLLRKRFDIKTIEARQLIYGRLFYPLAGPPPPRPAYMAPDGQTGRWLFVKEWDTHFSGDEKLLLIPKPLWPVVISTDLEELLEPVSAAHLIALADKHCTMFTIAGSPAPFFLVPDSWAKRTV